MHQGVGYSLSDGAGAGAAFHMLDLGQVVVAVVGQIATRRGYWVVNWPKQDWRVGHQGVEKVHSKPGVAAGLNCMALEDLDMTRAVGVGNKNYPLVSLEASTNALQEVPEEVLVPQVASMLLKAVK